MRKIVLLLMFFILPTLANAAAYQSAPPTPTSPNPGVFRKSDGAFIPNDPSLPPSGTPGKPGYFPGRGGNKDWDAYLAWLKKGNKPDPAPIDEEEQPSKTVANWVPMPPPARPKEEPKSWWAQIRSWL